MVFLWWLLYYIIHKTKSREKSHFRQDSFNCGLHIWWRHGVL